MLALDASPSSKSQAEPSTYPTEPGQMQPSTNGTIQYSCSSVRGGHPSAASHVINPRVSNKWRSSADNACRRRCTSAGGATVHHTSAKAEQTQRCPNVPMAIYTPLKLHNKEALLFSLVAFFAGIHSYAIVPKQRSRLLSHWLAFPHQQQPPFIFMR